jgi:hypothetical protein
MTTQVFSKPLPEPILSLFKLLASFLNFVPPVRVTLASRITPVTRHIVSRLWALPAPRRQPVRDRIHHIY